ERELRGLHVALAQRMSDVRDEVRVRELQARDVDAHVELGARADRTPFAHLPACLRNHPVAERNDESRLFRGRDEARGLEQATLRMVPAREGLEADEAAVAQRADRLVVEEDLPLAQRAPQLRLEPQLRGHVLVQAR